MCSTLTGHFTQRIFYFAASIAVLLVHVLRTFAAVARTIFGQIAFVASIAANGSVRFELIPGSGRRNIDAINSIRCEYLHILSVNIEIHECV